jgi:hypothetical protein
MIINDKLIGGRKEHMRVYIIFAILLAMLIGTSLAQNAATGDVNAFKQALEKDGFTVQQGELVFLDFIKLYDTGVMPSAWGNNPTTKYIGYFVPPAPGYSVDPQLSKIAKTLGISGNNSVIWSLRPDEAVVFVGRTPPECRYFSFDPTLQFRTYGNERRWVVAPVGDTLNMANIKTDGTPNGLPGNPYNQITIVITTADRGIDQRIRAAAQSTGYSGDMINTLVLPSSMLNMGLENNSDTFTIYIRPALYKDKQAGNEYLNNTPATILRITPNKTTALDPYDVPELKVRGTGKTEFDLMPDLEKLGEAILNKYSNLNATEVPTSQWYPNANEGFQRGINLYGPTNDACYLWTENQTLSAKTHPFNDVWQTYPFLHDRQILLSNNTSDFIIIYGVNHVATGKATYINAGIFGAKAWNGIGAITDVDLNGTAQEYLPDDPNAKYLYVYKIARNANGDQHCFELPTGPGAYGIALDQPLFIAWRIYFEPAAKTGPSYSEIVYDRAMKFSPKK